MRARRSSAKKARRSKAGIGKETKPWLPRNPPSAAPRVSPAAQGGCGRASAPVGPPFVEEYLRTDHRRCEGPHLAAASTLEKDLKGSLKTGADSAAAAAVGKLIAERATKAGVKEVVFDRGAVHLSRPRQGTRRSCPRRWSELLITVRRLTGRRISSSTVLPEKNKEQDNGTGT